MKVKDLIKALQACDQNAVVVKANNDFAASHCPLSMAPLDQQEMVRSETPYSVLFFEVEDWHDEDEDRQNCVII